MRTKKMSRLPFCARAAVALSALAGAAPAARAAIVFGQFDTFQDGTTQSWIEGGASPNPPTNVATGGPLGTGDRFLQDVSAGSFGAGSRLALFNQAQWAGDYNAAGVTRIDAFLANFGQTPLFMRVALEGGPSSSRFASTTAFPLPADGAWRRFQFDLTPAGLTSLGGTDSLAAVLGSVRTLRLLSAESGPAFNGDTVAATLGVDAVRALRRPGDANFDGTVNIADFASLQNHFNQSGTWADGDFNFDGVVNIADFAVLQNNFNTSDPSAAALAGGATAGDIATLAAFSQNVGAAPEPGTAGVAGLAGLGLLARRRHVARTGRRSGLSRAS